MFLLIPVFRDPPYTNDPRPELGDERKPIVVDLGTCKPLSRSLRDILPQNLIKGCGEPREARSGHNVDGENV